MLSTTRLENSRPDGFPVLEIAPAATDAPNSAPRRFVPLHMSELTGSVIGPLAELCLIQTFRFRRADVDRPIEALYRFPLPGDAAVTGVSVRFGDVRIDARLAERGEAEREYAAAKEQGRQAALTVRESPDVFTLHVAGIRPDEDVVVQTDYAQMARPEDGARWSLRVPLTTAPRYLRADETGSRAADGQPLALLRDPGHRFAMDLRIDGAADVRSGTHDLAVTPEGAAESAGTSVQRVRLAAGAVVPDRDLVLTWTACDADAAPISAKLPRLQVWLHDEPDDATYFLAQVAPPRRPAVAAFVATRSEATGAIGGALVVANSLPSGWNAGFVTMEREAGIAESSAMAGVANVKRQRTQSLQFLYEDQEAGRIVASGTTTWQTGHRYAGVPVFAGAEAVLIDSDRAPAVERISQLTLTFPRRNVPSAARLDPEVFLLLYVGDMSTPWARMRLADLRASKGVRPLHVERSAHERLRLVLVDPNGALAALSGGVPEMVVELT